MACFLKSSNEMNGFLQVRGFFLTNKLILIILSSIFNIRNLPRISIHSKNKLKYVGSFIYRTKIKVIGKENVVEIRRGAVLKNCIIFVSGICNKIVIGERCSLKDVELYIEDNGNILNIGSRTTISGRTHIACIEGTTISIGKDCMFSKDIIIRTGDSHSIIDKYGNRINKSKGVEIGDHVWIGANVTILKGSSIGEDSIIGTGSLITNNLEKNCVYGGNPVRKLKEDVTWKRERI